MKKFYCLFLIFCFWMMPLWAQETLNSQEKVLQHKVGQKVDHFVDEIYQAVDHALQTSKEDVNIIDNPDRFNLFSVFFLHENNGLFTGKKGLGEWQETPFGRFRLVSCEGNILSRQPLLLALEAQINEGWILNKPNIFAYQTLPQGIKSESIFYPIHNPYLQNDTTYQGSVLFLMYYELMNVQNDILFEKQALFSAQKENGEQQEKMLSFSLLMQKAEKSFQTDVCSAMRNELQYSPQNVYQNEVIVDALSTDNQLIQLNMTFQKKIKYIHLQIDTPFEWEIESKRVNKNDVQFFIKTKTPLPPNYELSLKILSSAGWYQLKTPVQNKDFKYLAPTIAWFDVFVAGILLFFLSPILSYFCSLKEKNKESLTKRINHFLIALFLVMGVTGLSVFTSLLSPQLLEMRFMYLIFGIVISLYLLWRAQLSLGMWVLCFCFMPKPYLTHTMNILSPYQWESLMVFLVWAAICALPFWLVRKQVWFFDQLRQTGMHFVILRRIPAICYLVWVMGVFGLPMLYESKELTSFEEISQEVNKGNVVYLSVENGYCLSCALNQTVLSLIYKEHFPASRFVQFTAPLYHDKEYDFIQKRQLPQNSYGIFFGNKKPYGEIVEGYVSPDDWDLLLMSVYDFPNPITTYIKKSSLFKP